MLLNPLFILYIVCFVFLKKHLTDLKLYLTVRESYYKDFSLLDKENPFQPLTKAPDTEAELPFNHNFFWFFPVIALFVSVFNSIVILYLP